MTDARKGYADGALRLIIPKLGVDVPVLDGVDAQTLLRGVGLYDYAQLPGEGGANTSIARPPQRPAGRQDHRQYALLLHQYPDRGRLPLPPGQ